MKTSLEKAEEIVDDYAFYIGSGVPYRSTLEKSIIDAFNEYETKLSLAREALEQIARAYYEKHGGITAWRREFLEEAIVLDTKIAREALEHLK